MGRYLAILDATTGRHADAPAGYDINDKNDKSPPLVVNVVSVVPPDSREWTAADWLALFNERAGIREFDGQRPRARAEQLAWGELQNEWHRRHGEHTPSWQCAGCREPISGQPVFAFPDGARAHDDLTCIATYGKRWRSAATAALVKLGLPKPTTLPEDDMAAWSSWGSA